MKREYLEAGKIVNKRGLSGELKIESYCDTPQAFCSFKRIFLTPDGSDMRRIISAKLYGGYVYIKIEGVTNVDLAEALKGRLVYIHRDDMKIGIDDILGLHVYDADTSADYGVLTEVFNRGASDIYRIEKDGKEYLIPAVKDIVIKIDPDSGIFIRPIPGLIDDAEEIR